MPIHDRVICSTITLRNRPLSEALATIHSLGFGAVDLGALPGVCNHVPDALTFEGVEEVGHEFARQPLQVASVNADIGDLNAPVDESVRGARARHLSALVAVCHAVGSPALVLPCGSQGHEPITDLDTDLDRVAETLRAAAEELHSAGIQLWVEAQHSGRLCFSTERAARLMDRLDGSGVGAVMDFSHIVASQDDPLSFVETFGDRISHVHVRDAVPGDIHLSVGRGDVDFSSGISALESRGYAGRYSLELETRDVTEEERPEAARQAGLLISGLLAPAMQEVLR